MKSILLALTSLISYNTIGQIASKGDLLLDGYIGGPNFSKYFSKLILLELEKEFDDIKNVTVKGTPSFGGKIEYTIANRFGLALELHFQQTSIEWTRDSIVVDQFNISNQTIIPFKYALVSSKAAILPTICFHVLKDEKSDFFITLGLGYRQRNYRFKTDVAKFKTPAIPGIQPVAFRLSLGYKYFVTPNVGFHFGFGIGGPLFNAGLSLRLNTTTKTVSK